MIAAKKRVADISRRGQVERLKLRLFGTGPAALNLLGLAGRSGLRAAFFAPNSLSRSEVIEKWLFIVFPIFFSLNLLNSKHCYSVPEGRSYRRASCARRRFEFFLYTAAGAVGCSCN